MCEQHGMRSGQTCSVIFCLSLLHSTPPHHHPHHPHHHHPNDYHHHHYHPFNHNDNCDDQHHWYAIAVPYKRTETRYLEYLKDLYCHPFQSSPFSHHRHHHHRHHHHHHHHHFTTMGIIIQKLYWTRYFFDLTEYTLQSTLEKITVKQ